MAVAPRRTRRRPYGALLLLALMIMGLGWVLYLRLTDQPLRDPFGFYQPEVEGPTARQDDGRTEIPELAEGRVRVMISAREIQAYSKVTRDDLFDRSRGIFAYADVDKDFAEENGVFIGTVPILGRVMKRTKRPGFAFTEEDFLPEGTRPGLAGGIPPGKRAMRIDVDLVRGIIGLNPGDRFDLVAARTVTPPGAAPAAPRDPNGPAFVGVYSELMDRQSQPAASKPRSMEPEARVDVVVQGGVVVSALETRLVPTSSSSLTAGQINGTRPVQEMVIALGPDEVAPLMAALRLESDLTCVARSGRPEDPQDSVTPGLGPKADESEVAEEDGDMTARGHSAMPAGYEDAQFTVVETIVGGERTLVTVPKPTGGVDR